MTKKFCDICGNEAIQDNPDLVVYKNIGVSGSPEDGGTEGLSIRAFVAFSHYQGDQQTKKPVDLCPSCRVHLLHELWAKAEDNRLKE